MKGQRISLLELAQAMLKTDQGFAEEVGEFEERFGKTDRDTVCVLAQAKYFCWFECEYERDLLEVCRAIGQGKPTTLFLCDQVSPRRWQEMNTYVIGVQRWRGVDDPLPAGLNARKVAQIAEWLGARSAGKDALADLFLAKLILALSSVSPTKLAQADDEPDEYPDFTSWWARSDGSAFPTKRGWGALDGFVVAAREAAGSHKSEDLEELIEGIVRESQPPCMYRYSRYLDIMLASIGTLKWRGNVPPDNEVPKRGAEEWFAKADIEGWVKGNLPANEVARRSHGLLGVLDERKKAIVEMFLLVPAASDAFCTWLREKQGSERLSIRDMISGH